MGLGFGGMDERPDIIEAQERRMMNATALAKSEIAKPQMDPAEVDILAAWMWGTHARAAGTAVEYVSDEAWEALGSKQSFWRAHARGYLVDQARRSG